MQFYVINSSIYGLDYTDAIVRKYDKVWNLQESHDAHQVNYQGLTSKSASRSYEYNSELQKYQLKSWEDREPSYTQKKRYGFSVVNFTEFYQGEESLLYYIKQTNKTFITKQTAQAKKWYINNTQYCHSIICFKKNDEKYSKPSYIAKKPLYIELWNMTAC